MPGREVEGAEVVPAPSFSQNAPSPANCVFSRSSVARFSSAIRAAFSAMDIVFVVLEAPLSESNELKASFCGFGVLPTEADLASFRCRADGGTGESEGVREGVMGRDEEEV